MQRVSIRWRLRQRWTLLVAVAVIDDVVNDEGSVNTLNAFTYCLDKSG